VRVRGACAAALLCLTACGSSVARSSSETRTGATPPPARAACGPAAARTLAANGLARVYEDGGAVYGCARGAGRSYRLGSAERSLREGRAAPVALAGVLAAYGLASFGVDTGSSLVVVRRLSDGRRLKTLAALTRSAGPESFTTVSSVVVRTDGAVAWIATARSIISHGTEIEVHRSDSRGRALLAASSRVVPGSLRLRGSLLSWREGGTTRTTRLR